MADAVAEAPDLDLPEATEVGGPGLLHDVVAGAPARRWAACRSPVRRPAGCRRRRTRRSAAPARGRCRPPRPTLSVGAICARRSCRCRRRYRTSRGSRTRRCRWPTAGPMTPLCGRLDRVLHDPTGRLVHAPARLHGGRRGRRRSDDDRRRSRGATGGDGQPDRGPDARQDCSTHDDAPIVSVVVTCAGSPRPRRTSPTGWHATAPDPPDRHATMAMCGLLTTECRDPTAAGERRPPHALGPRVVPDVPGPPPGARRGARRPPRRPRGRPRAHPLPARRPAGRGRRLPRAAARARGASCGRTSRSGPHRDGPLVHAARRVPRLGRDPRARPRARDGPGRRAGRTGGRRDGRRLPARHVRPHRPDAAAPRGGPASTHAVVWRGVPGAIDRTGFWWEAPDGTPCGPSTCRPATATAPGCRTTPAPSSPGSMPGSRARRRPRPRRPDPADERHRPPPPPARSAVAARRGDRGEHRALRRTPQLAARARRRRARGRPAPLAGRAAQQRPRQPAARRHLQPRSTSARPRREPNGCSSRRPSPCGRRSLPAGLWPGRALDLAWQAMVRNAAHDSVCACSDDEVVDAVHHRYAEARQIGDALRDQGLRLVGAALAGEEPVAVNTLARPRGGLVQVTRPGHRPEPGEQLLGRDPAADAPPHPSGRGRARGAGVRARRPPADPRAWPSSTPTTARSSCTCRPTGPLGVASPRWPQRGPHALAGRDGAAPRRSHPGGRCGSPRGAGAGRGRPRLRVGSHRGRAGRARSLSRTGASPMAWPAWSSTPRPGRSCSTGTVASAGSSTTATRATPTTTARRTMTSSSTSRRRWWSGWANRDRSGPAWSSTPATGSPERVDDVTSSRVGAADPRGVDRRRAAGRRALRARDDHRRQCLRGPSAAGVVPAAGAGAARPRPGVPSRPSRAASTSRAARRRPAWRPTLPVASYRRAVSPSRTRACRSTSWSTSSRPAPPLSR